MDRVPGGVLSLAEDLRIVGANAEAGAIAGCPQGELIGRSFEALLTGASAILFQTHVFPALRADGRVAEVFLTLRGADGQAVPILLNGVRHESPGQRTYEFLFVRILARARWEADLLASARALAEEKAASERLAHDLERSAAEKRRTDAFREAFIGIVSHELRTPITTIYGMSEFLRGHHAGLDDATRGQYLDDVAAEADRLRRLTEDLLVLSRAEGGRLDLSADPVLVGHLAGRVVDSVTAAAPEHVLSLEVRDPLPVVLGDEPFIEQVLRNLLSNAVKYSPPGTSVSVRVSKDDGGVAVRVTDAGPGFGDTPPDRLFELFYRTADAKRRTGGAGIGLFVCRELVHAMGGRIWAAPAPAPAASGAEFGFWLPASGDDRPDR